MPDISSTDLSALQKVRKRRLAVGAVLLFALLVLLASRSPSDAFAHRAVAASGLAFIILCILGRTWCALYIGGKKRREIVTVGPFSVVRNPLYIFSMFGATGVGLLTGSLVIGAVVLTCTIFVFRSVVRAEETFLLQTFGDSYSRYCDQVPRWIPRFAGWRDVREIVVRPKLVLVTFRDACLFLVAVPLFDQIDKLQVAGIVPVLLRLP